MDLAAHRDGNSQGVAEYVREASHTAANDCSISTGRLLLAREPTTLTRYGT